MSFIYRTLIAIGDKIVPNALQPIWQHPAGPKTIFFWGPVVKWGLVVAGLGDLTRPADQISVSQATALAGTGVVWSRYSVVIIPKNYNLLSVNMAVALTQSYQLVRAINYHYGNKETAKDQGKKK